MQLAISEASEKERQDILKVQGEIYERDYLSSLQPFNCIRDVFRILTESGARVALATDCKGLAFKLYISLLNADEFIAATACGDDVEHGKPDPRLVGMAMRKLAVPGSHSVMVGDTPYDAEAGLEAGARAACSGLRPKGAAIDLCVLRTPGGRPELRGFPNNKNEEPALSRRKV